MGRGRTWSWPPAASPMIFRSSRFPAGPGPCCCDRGGARRSGRGRYRSAGRPSAQRPTPHGRALADLPWPKPESQAAVGGSSPGSSPRRQLALDLLVELDRADRVLVGELVEHLVDDAQHLGLVVAEVVEQGAERGMSDLELRRGQLQVVVELGAPLGSSEPWSLTLVLQPVAGAGSGSWRPPPPHRPARRSSARCPRRSPRGRPSSRSRRAGRS